MNTSFLRPALLTALALSLSACGGKATFPINVALDTTQSDGLVYPSLELTETVSGQKLVFDKAGATSGSFANTLEYGSSYNVTVTKQPPQQACTVINGADTAGRRASIDVTISCTVNRFSVTGTAAPAAVNGGAIEGLELINGSEKVDPEKVVTATPTYIFPQVKFGTAFGLAIFKQPAGSFCSLVPKKVPEKTVLTTTTAAFTMPNENVTIDISCVKL